ncbi:EscD/YscD/HrpQ family type III secretion system inner membrane ring protein [Yersinia rohdei]|nr:EscD/YscD/HrpQ family type III secretion system inner membrane ring protein [Yersinia rohdei]
MALGFKLRLMSGELNGRELSLPEGEFTLGEQGCDVLLPLPQGQVLTLVISENKILLRAPGKVWINGCRHDLQHPIPLRQVIEVAGLILVLGEEADALNSIILSPRSRKRVLLWLSMATLIFLLLLFVFIFWFAQQSNRLFSYLPPDIPTQLSEQLKQPVLAGVTADWSSEGSVILSGHCLSSSAVTQLQNFLVQHQVVFRNKLVCDDHLISSVSDILHQYGYQDIEVRAGISPGNITLYGSIEMGEQWLNVQEALTTVAGLTGWTVINPHDGQMIRLVESLRKLNLLGYLSMMQSHKDIVISGVLSPDQKQKLSQMLAQLTQKESGALPVQYQNIPVSDQTTQLLPAAIVSYGGNNHAKFIQLANGARLQQGTVLENGYKVIFISEQGISLLKANNLIQIPMSF